MSPSSYDFLSKSTHRNVRKLLGRSYLRESRIKEALEVFLGLLQDFPDDAEVLIVLANLYRLAGSPLSAARLYRQVPADSPAHPVAQSQLAQIEPLTGDWEEAAPADPEAVKRLAQHLRAVLKKGSVDEIRSAADLVDKIPPGEVAVDGMSLPAEDLQQLMPALIELNIRQARAAGRKDLAEALQSLQIKLSRQVDERWADDLLRDQAPFNPGLQT